MPGATGSEPTLRFKMGKDLSKGFAQRPGLTRKSISDWFLGACQNSGPRSKLSNSKMTKALSCVIRKPVETPAMS